MLKITREQLHGYLEDALSEAETSRVEQALRESESLRRLLRSHVHAGQHFAGFAP